MGKNYSNRTGSGFQEGWTSDVKDEFLDNKNSQYLAEYSDQFSVRAITEYLISLRGVKKILDVGCADGKLLGRFNDKFDIYGVDISSRFVKFAKRNGLKAKVADLEKKIPFPDDFFDVIVIHHVLEHVLNTDNFLSECNRVLTKNGVILLTFPNVSSPISFILMLLDYPMYMGARYRSTHVRDFTLRTTKIALANNGFKVEKVFGGSFLFLKNNSFSFITKYFPRAAADITIKAKKVISVGRMRSTKYEYGVNLKDYFKDFFK